MAKEAWQPSEYPQKRQAYEINEDCLYLNTCTFQKRKRHREPVCDGLYSWRSESFANFVISSRMIRSPKFGNPVYLKVQVGVALDVEMSNMHWERIHQLSLSGFH